MRLFGAGVARLDIPLPRPQISERLCVFGQKFMQSTTALKARQVVYQQCQGDMMMQVGPRPHFILSQADLLLGRLAVGLAGASASHSTVGRCSSPVRSTDTTSPRRPRGCAAVEKSSVHRLGCLLRGQAKEVSGAQKGGLHGY